MSRDCAEQIRGNAAKVREMHSRVHETFGSRDKSPADRQAWKDACAVFHANFETLAFPGGYRGAPERVRAGEPDAVESALVFLELRPYFFNSGYMFKKLLRCVKHAPLSPEQAARLLVVIEKQTARRERRLDLRRAAK